MEELYCKFLNNFLQAFILKLLDKNKRQKFHVAMKLLPFLSRLNFTLRLGKLKLVELKMLNQGAIGITEVNVDF